MPRTNKRSTTHHNTVSPSSFVLVALILAVATMGAIDRHRKAHREAQAQAYAERQPYGRRARSRRRGRSRSRRRAPGFEGVGYGYGNGYEDGRAREYDVIPPPRYERDQEGDRDGAHEGLGVHGHGDRREEWDDDSETLVDGQWGRY